MRSKSKANNLKADINIVPFLDILLVLVVILMASVSSVYHSVTVNLPQAATKSTLKLSNQDYPLLITLHQNGLYEMKYRYINDNKLEGAKLFLKLKAFHQKYPNVKIMLQADQHCPYQQVINAMAMMNQAGFSQIGLVTEGQKK